MTAASGSSHHARDAIVVGAGPTGLAVAAALGRHGLSAVVLERGEDVGAAWRSRYAALRLNSGRPFSALPGLRFPPGTPMFPGRDDVVGYLSVYRERLGIEVRTSTRVERLDPAGDGWRVTTSGGVLAAPHVLVATGRYAEPALPPPLAAAGSGGSAVPVVHSAHYADAGPYRGRDVLVVGPGSSGMEIAHDLAAGGARRVLLSVRTPPNMLPRSVAGLPGDPAVLLLLRLPPRLADVQLRLLRRLLLGDLRDQGLPVPAAGPFTRLRQNGADPAVVDREVLQDLRAGRIRVVADVVGLADRQVRLGDGTTLSVDAVVAATGFRPGLEGLVGHLGVLDPSGAPTAVDDRAARPGLRFVNFRVRPGLLGAAGRSARDAAAAVAREVAASGHAGSAPGPVRVRGSRQRHGPEVPFTGAGPPHCSGAPTDSRSSSMYDR